jgi:hypothetical protein
LQRTPGPIAWGRATLRKKYGKGKKKEKKKEKEKGNFNKEK